MGGVGGGGGRQSPPSSPHSEKTKKPGLPKGQSQGPSASTGAFPGGMRLSCTQRSGSWFRVLGPISGGLTHPGPPGGWKRACPPEQPRALTALAIGILQGFTPGSNQGTHGGRDSRGVPSFQHRDRALSEPDDQENCLEVVTSVLGLRNLATSARRGVGGRRVREQGPLWVCVSKVSEGDWSARWELACTPTSQSLECHGSIASNTFGQSLS